MLSSGLIPCRENHNHEVVLVNAYRTDLYLAWSVEAAYRLAKESHVSLHIVDLSEICMDKQMSGVAKYWRTFRKKKDSKAIVQLFSRYTNSILICKEFSAYIIFRNFAQVLRFHFKRVKLFDTNSVKWKAVHSTFATEVATVEYSLFTNIVRLSVLATSFDQSYTQTTKFLAVDKYCSVLLGNSRLVNAAGCMAASKNRGVETLVLERGARPGFLDTYRISPHSNKERKIHAIQLWSSLPENTAIDNAISYMKLRQEFEPISGIKWNRNMESGLTPPLNPLKKTCVFYSSTEIEFAVFGDTPAESEFKSQSEAVQALIRNLDPNEWDVVIRRHPYRDRKYSKDPEGRLWREFAQLPNITVIGPESKYDSYALVQKANLVAHFNSSMGPEAIFMQSTPVITMGPTMWEEDDNPYNCTTEHKLIQLINSNFSVRPISDVWVWANYWNSFGEAFCEIKWIPPRAFLNNKRILSK